MSRIARLLICLALVPALLVTPGFVPSAAACSVAYPKNRRTMDFEGQAVSRSRMPQQANSEEFRGYLWTFKITKWIKSSSGVKRQKNGSMIKVNVFERNDKGKSFCLDRGVEAQFQQGQTYRVGATKFPLRTWYVDNYIGNLTII
jgi:hypothetical protein